MKPTGSKIGGGLVDEISRYEKVSGPKLDEFFSALDRTHIKRSSQFLLRNTNQSIHQPALSKTTYQSYSNLILSIYHVFFQAHPRLCPWRLAQC
jgi:hypothetical protein